jgi:tetratricopeptide (TPR) repeat protein
VPFDSCAGRVQQAQVSFEGRAFQKAAQEFNEALKVCPQRDAILISLGQTQFLAGDEAAAEQTFLQSNTPAARYALGRMYYQQARYPEAASQLEQVTAREPDNYRAHDNLALCYDALQRDSDALKHFFRTRPAREQPEMAEAAVELDSTHGEAHYQLSQVLRRLGRTEEARTHLEIFRKLRGPR